jgi:hypothetical protein
LPTETTAEQRFATTMAHAIAVDVRDHPPAGPVVRAVLRWFEEDDPLYFTVHVLGADERAAVSPQDAWDPLEWPNVDRELERADRIEKDSDLKVAAAALALQDDDLDPGELPAPAILAAIRALPDAFRAAGVPVTEDLAVTGSHFEGWGMLAVFRAFGATSVLAALEARGELPTR